MPHARRLRVTVAGGAWFGETGQQEKVRRFAREHPELHVDVPGHVDDVLDLIDRHDVLLHTSLLPEPFGQVVVQGMARGRVVVAADSGGPAEVISRAATACSTAWAARTTSPAPSSASPRAARRSPSCGSAARTAHRYHPHRTGARYAASSTTCRLS